MKEIFISYRSADLENGCIQVYEHLVKEFGYDEVIFAHSNFKSGTDWFPQIRAGVAGSRVIVLIIGKSWEQQEDSLTIDRVDYLEQELTLANKLKIPIVPVCVGIDSKNLNLMLPAKFKWVHKIHAVNFNIKTSSSPELINELVEILHKFKIKQGKSESNSLDVIIRWLSLSASQVARLCFSPISATCRILVVSPKSILLVIGELTYSLMILFLSMNAIGQLEIDYSFLNFLYKAQSYGFYFLFLGGLIYCFLVYFNKQIFSFRQLITISIHFLSASLIYLSIMLTAFNYFMHDEALDIIYESVEKNPNFEIVLNSAMNQLSSYDQVVFLLILFVGSYAIMWNFSGVIRGLSISHGNYRVWSIWLFVYSLNILLSFYALYLSPSGYHTNLPLKFNWLYNTDKVTASGTTKGPVFIEFKGDITFHENLFHINEGVLLIENREPEPLILSAISCYLGYMESNEFRWFTPLPEGRAAVNSTINKNETKQFRISTIKIPIPGNASFNNTIVSCFVEAKNVSYPVTNGYTFLKW